MDFMIERTYVMQCAHHLPLAPEGHRCAKVHGHTYAITVRVEGPLDDHDWVMDFGELDELVGPEIEALDHTDLNERWDNPTSEVIAAHIFQLTTRKLGERAQRLQQARSREPRCTSVRIVENDRSCVEARPS